MVLPVFPNGSTQITRSLAFEKSNGMVYYFHGCVAIFSHLENDLASFRMFISQQVVIGNCRQVEIVKAFGVPPISVKRAVKKYREKDPAVFSRRKREVEHHEF